MQGGENGKKKKTVGDAGSIKTRYAGIMMAKRP